MTDVIIQHLITDQKGMGRILHIEIHALFPCKIRVYYDYAHYYAIDYDNKLALSSGRRNYLSDLFAVKC